MKRFLLMSLGILALACEPQPLPPQGYFAGGDTASLADAGDSGAGADAVGDGLVANDGSDAAADSSADADAVADVGVDTAEISDSQGDIPVDALSDAAADSSLDTAPDVLADTPVDASNDADANPEVDTTLDVDIETADLASDATPGCAAEAAVCNGQDDDCDGQTDEACSCANAAYLAPDCTACAEGYEAIPTATGQACAADFPAWGARPDSPPSGWFVDLGDGTVSDTQSKLLWQKGFSPAGQTWDAAQKYCFGLTLGGFKDWRMPTVAELVTLRDLNKAAPAIAGAFSGTPSEFFWTAMPLQLTPDEAWSVFFSAGMTITAAKTSPFHVRCVR